MRRNLKVSTIRNYMSLIRTSMPEGQQPDNSLYLRLLGDYRRKNKRASRRKEAFPITLQYLVPMMLKAEEDNRPIGWRDAAMLAFGYRFLARSIEEVNLDMEDLTILDDRIKVWLLEDKTHNDDQTLTLHDHPDLGLVKRMRRWLEYLTMQGITTGPLFRHLQKDGAVAVGHREQVATVRGDYLRPQTVNERVKHWFSKAGLVSDGRPVSSHGLRAGAATDLGMNDATDKEIAEAGRWRPDSPIPRLVYVRPAQAAKQDPFSKIPRYGTEPHA
jgi:integrase